MARKMCSPKWIALFYAIQIDFRMAFHMNRMRLLFGHSNYLHWLKFIHILHAINNEWIEVANGATEDWHIGWINESFYLLIILELLIQFGSNVHIEIARCMLIIDSLDIYLWHSIIYCNPEKYVEIHFSAKIRRIRHRNTYTHSLLNIIMVC